MSTTVYYFYLLQSSTIYCYYVFNGLTCINGLIIRLPINGLICIIIIIIMLLDIHPEVSSKNKTHRRIVVPWPPYLECFTFK